MGSLTQKLVAITNGTIRKVLIIGTLGRLGNQDGEHYAYLTEVEAKLNKDFSTYPSKSPAENTDTVAINDGGVVKTVTVEDLSAGLGEIDGGSSSTVFVTEQNIDGGDVNGN